MTLLFGLAALAVLLWMAQKYLQADPRKLAAVLKLSGGIAALAFAAFFAVRGQLAIAVPLGMTGFPEISSSRPPHDADDPSQWGSL